MKNILTKRSLYTVVNVVIVLAIIAYFGFREFQKVALHQFLPEETIYKHQLQSEIHDHVSMALGKVMDSSDYELVVHVDLFQDEISEEQIKYKPNELMSNSTVENLIPIPKINTLPGLVENPFHNESLPGFPSYFDQFEIKKTIM